MIDYSLKRWRAFTRFLDDARAWLADVLARIADHPASKVTDLLPWDRKTQCANAQAA